MTGTGETGGTAGAERRARRLVRCYPHEWRERHGEEFTQLLIDDISERPHSLTRTADVLRAGLVARLACAGLAGDITARQLRAGLGTLGLSVGAFLAIAVAVWSQLTIGWQWSAPAAPATKTGMLLMSTSMLAFAALAVSAAIPLLGALTRELSHRRGRGTLALPLIAATLGAAALVAGSVHFGHGWPGTGGHPWTGRDLVPAAVARFCWASTLWITSYWAHPGALSSFPASEIAWMIAAPVILLGTVIGAAQTLRRLPLSARVLRFEARLGLTAAVAMAAFLAGASSWIVSGGPAPHGLFRVGAIDLIGVAVMAAALVVAFRAAQRSLSAGPTRAGAQ
jgi:hypothetical protein